MNTEWSLTYNLILCAICFPMLAFFGARWIKGLDSKIQKICEAIQKLHDKLDNAIEKLDSKKRDKPMCDEKMEHLKEELKNIISERT